jgi:phosphopantothenoylcysteine decarboxylase/phosphopantothenate--cysteine ligase
MSGTVSESQRTAPREIVLGVSGGIAAYKAASLLRLFTESGDNVTVVPTASALKFVGAATWEALSGRPVSTDVFDNVDSVQHVRIGQQADLVVVAPATANTLAKAAHGLADDLLSTTLLASRAPVLFAPAMHTEMWEHPATQANVRTLRERGNIVLEPAVGRLTGIDSGPGRLPEPDEIFTACHDLLSVPAKLTCAGNTSSYRLVAPVSTSTQSGSSATGRLVDRATPWPRLRQAEARP